MKIQGVRVPRRVGRRVFSLNNVIKWCGVVMISQSEQQINVDKDPHAPTVIASHVDIFRFKAFFPLSPPSFILSFIPFKHSRYPTPLA